MNTDVLKNILSIGFEFETDSLIKLSMQKDGTLLNTHTTNRSLGVSIKYRESTQLNDHYVSTNTPSLKYIEYISEPDLDGDTINTDITLDVLTDLSISDFRKEVFKPLCDPIKDVSKNDMYVYKTNKYSYPIQFTPLLQDRSCDTCAIVEWIVTYYSPKQTSNIVWDTFIDAISRIYNQIQSLQKVKGALFIKDSTKKYKIAPYPLYHYPNTNLFFLHAANSKRQISILDESLSPQFTFKVSWEHCIDVMLELVNLPIVENEKASRFKSQCKIFTYDINAINKCVNTLFEKYNKPIDLDSTEIKKVKVYLFLIFYKIFAYVNYFYREDNSIADIYFKNYLEFCCRHSNYVLYSRIKELIDVDVFMDIINQPNIIKMIYRRKENRNAIRKDAMENFGTEKFGDPTVSFMSYFTFMETPLSEIKEDEDEDTFMDWFTFKEFEISAQFDLKDDLILIENRIFGRLLLAILKNLKINDDINTFNLRHIPKMIELIQHENISNYRYNAKTKKNLKKCKPGYSRNKSFKCVKTTKQFTNLIHI